MKITYDLSQIETVATQLLGLTQSATLLFYGEMGVGKTTLIKELIHQLGVTEMVQSPTFSIVNEYVGAQGEIIYHFDCYRLQNEEEILDLGFEDYLTQGDWIFIEWPGKIANFLTVDIQKLQLKLHKNNEREVLLC